MNRWMVLLAVSSCCLMLAMGCSSSAGDPVSNDLTASRVSTNGTQTHLWGYYDVHIDIPTQTATAVLNREAMFTANVVNFINGKPAGLSFHINDTPLGADYVDVDIDVTINHPFPGMPQYNGYDVRGVFMGDGSSSMAYNPELIYPMLGIDQMMLPDPDDGIGGPDGYTRWFNLTEFSTGGMLLFQYTPGKMASPGFVGVSTLNPYRYFADGLGVNEDLWTWLDGHAGQHGVFSSGASNTRNYYLRFPNAKGVDYGYAIIANWGGTEPQFHPSNTPEAVALSVVDGSDVYFKGPSEKGGNLRLDISVWDWDSHPSGGVMSDYRLFVESTVLSNPYEFNTDDMTPTGGAEHYSTYHVEIPADSIAGVEGNEYWLIVEQQGYDYTNEFGVSNLAGTDPLAAFFRHDLAVGNQAPSSVKILSPNGGEIWDAASHHDITWTTASYSGNIKLEYSKDGFASDIHEIIAGTPNDGVFDWFVPDDPSDTVRVRATLLGIPSVHDDSDADFIISSKGWAVTWGGAGREYGNWVAVDGSGNTYVAGSFSSATDFDPGDGVDIHSPNGGFDTFVCKFDLSGKYQWARTWGGPGADPGFPSWFEGATGCAVDSSGNVYVPYTYQGTCDLDPGLGVDWHTPVGDYDAGISKFDTSGAFMWARTWGGSWRDAAMGVVLDGSGGVYVNGLFSYSADFDPGPGVDNRNSNGAGDVFLVKFDSAGTVQWVDIWGGGNDDWGTGIACDGSGNVFVAGIFAGTVDFDPGTGVDNHSATTMWNAFLSKLSSAGGFQWARTWGGSSTVCNSVACDSSANIYACGYFYYSTDLDPGPGVDSRTAVGSSDAYLSKFDPSGNYLWGRVWGDTGTENGTALATSASGNSFITGYFADTVDFDPGPGVDSHAAAPPYDAYVVKFDSSGDFMWANTWGASVGDDESNAVAVSGSGYSYVTGRFEGTVDFDPGAGVDDHVTNGLVDSYLVKFKPDGTW